jgi:hypothetical protein
MVDIRIMAHPSRRENVIKILSKLSLQEDVVIWDDRENGGDAMYTAKKAWTSPVPNGCTHRLVLQDDIEICDNFIDIVEQISKKNTSQIVSLFHCEKYEDNIRYISTRRLWGCAIIMPVSFIPLCWEYIEHIPEKPWCGDNAETIMRHDNDCIALWSIDNSIPVINTIPSLVQHIGDNSLVGIKEIRIAQDFIKSPPLTGW